MKLLKLSPIILLLVLANCALAQQSNNPDIVEYDRCRESCNVFSGFGECLDRCTKKLQDAEKAKRPSTKVKNKPAGEYTFQDMINEISACSERCRGHQDGVQCNIDCQRAATAKHDRTLKIRAEKAEAADIAKDLKSEPFSFPDEFPRPKDVYDLKIIKPLKGEKSLITFKTKMPLAKLASYYQQFFNSKGLRLLPSYSGQSIEHFSLVFAGWPGHRSISISSFDEAFRSQNDYRFVTASIAQR